MVVKEKRGRYRYILFKNNGESREQIAAKIKKSPVKIKIAFYSDEYAIVRCRHTDKEAAISFLNSIGMKTLKTSGTIKKLKRLIGFSKPQPGGGGPAANSAFFIALFLR